VWHGCLVEHPYHISATAFKSGRRCRLMVAPCSSSCRCSNWRDRSWVPYTDSRETRPAMRNAPKERIVRRRRTQTRLWFRMLHPRNCHQSCRLGAPAPARVYGCSLAKLGNLTTAEPVICGYWTGCGPSAKGRARLVSPLRRGGYSRAQWYRSVPESVATAGSAGPILRVPGTQHPVSAGRVLSARREQYSLL